MFDNILGKNISIHYTKTEARKGQICNQSNITDSYHKLKKGKKKNRLQRTESSNCIFFYVPFCKILFHVTECMGTRAATHANWGGLFISHRFPTTFLMHVVKAKGNLGVMNFPHSYGKGNCRSILQAFQHRKLKKYIIFCIFISYVLLHNFWTRELV